jgi:hypothetical protein
LRFPGAPGDEAHRLPQGPADPWHGLVELCSPGCEGRAEVELPLGKVLIAAQLGMQPETLSRPLAKLRGLGVETLGNRVVVGDLGRLRAMCGTTE